MTNTSFENIQNQTQIRIKEIDKLLETLKQTMKDSVGRSRLSKENQAENLKIYQGLVEERKGLVSCL